MRTAKFVSLGTGDNERRRFSNLGHRRLPEAIDLGADGIFSFSSSFFRSAGRLRAHRRPAIVAAAVVHDGLFFFLFLFFLYFLYTPPLTLMMLMLGPILLNSASALLFPGCTTFIHGQLDPAGQQQAGRDRGDFSFFSFPLFFFLNVTHSQQEQEQAGRAAV